MVRGSLDSFTEESRLFDQTYILTLPGALNRQIGALRQILKLRLSPFKFVVGTKGGDQSVLAAYQTGQVRDFPPCFRCKQMACGSNDCNNILIPAQIGNFLSHLKLLELVAKKNQFALIVEDDVVFREDTHELFGHIKTELIRKGLSRYSRPLLLRLGGAYGADHLFDLPLQLSEKVVMANPAYAVNGAFARKALEKFISFTTTSDIFIHKEVPEEGEAFTVLPLLADEKSWSRGSVSSTIHPKRQRVAYLTARKRRVATHREEQRIENHISHVEFRSFLIVGHPRSGTGYAASVMRQLGFDVGHEATGADGISSWQFAAEDINYPYFQDKIASSKFRLRWANLIQVVRNPSSAIPSIMNEDKYSIKSFEFRRKHLLKTQSLDLEKFQNPLDCAVVSYVGWNRMIQQMRPNLIFRIEDGQSDLVDYLKSQNFQPKLTSTQLVTTPVNAKKAYHGRIYPKPEIGAADWEKLSGFARDELLWFCSTFDYPPPVQVA